MRKYTTKYKTYVNALIVRPTDPRFLALPDSEARWLYDNRLEAWRAAGCLTHKKMRRLIRREVQT